MFKIVFIIFFSLSFVNLNSEETQVSLENVYEDFSSDLSSFDDEISSLDGLNVKPLTRDMSTKLMKNKLEDNDVKTTANYILSVSKLSKYADETREQAIAFADNTDLKASKPEVYKEICNMSNARANIAELNKQKYLLKLIPGDKKEKEEKINKINKEIENNKKSLSHLISKKNKEDKKIDEKLLADIGLKNPDFSVENLPDDLEIQGEECCYKDKVEKGTCVDENGEDICTKFVLNKIKDIRANVVDANMLDNCSTIESFSNTVADMTKIITEDYLPYVLLGKVDSVESYGKALAIAKRTNNQEVINSLKVLSPDLHNLYEGNVDTKVYTKGAGQLNFSVPPNSGDQTSGDKDIPGSGAANFFSGLETYSDNISNTYSSIKGGSGGNQNIENYVEPIYKYNYLSDLENKITGGRDFGNDESEDSSNSLNYYTTEQLVNSYSDMMENYVAAKYDPFNSEALEGYLKSSYEYELLNSFSFFYNFSNYTKLNNIYDLFLTNLYADNLNNLKDIVSPVNISASKNLKIKFKIFLKELRAKILKYKKQANLAKAKLRKALKNKVKYPKAPSNLRAMKDLHDMEILRRNLNTNIYRINKAIKYHRSKKIYIPKKVYNDYEKEYKTLNSSMEKTLKSVSRAKDKIQKSLPDVKSIEESKNKDLVLRKIAKEMLAKGI